MRRIPLLWQLAVLILSWDPEPLELHSGLVAAAWGFWVASPWWRTFAACPRLYAGLAGLMGEREWGLLLLAGGLIQLTAVWMTSQTPQSDHRRYWRLLKVRRWVAGCAMLTWGLVAWQVALGDWRAPSVVLYGVIGLSSLLTYLRLSLAGRPL